MKFYIFIFIILFKTTLFSQELNILENQLNKLIEKRIFWSENQNDQEYDSLSKYNNEFEKLILTFSSTNTNTLSYKFNKIKVGLNIVTSTDGLFRIYTWNTFEGGTMQFYKNIFQYKFNGKVYSKLNKKDDDDNGCSFFEINDVVTKGKHFYITSSISVGSSALYFYEAKIFSIQGGKFLENENLIKTKSGLKNTLGYSVDLSDSSNRDRKDGIESRDYIALIYDRKNKVIIIPLINGDGKVTKNKIKYQFNGKFFQKI